MLAQWAAAESRAVGWVSLDHYDDDPVSLIMLLAASFAKATDADPEIVAGLRDVVAVGRAAPYLASALRVSPVPFVMFVDDLQVLGGASSDVIEEVLDGIPLGSQFVAASRSAQPHVAPLRPTDDVIEIGSEELALDGFGAQRVFAEQHVDLTPELAQAVIARTEGWPVGVHLAAMIAQDRNGSHSDLATFDGRDRYVADYLQSESFGSLSEPAQLFLRRSAILNDMCDDVCQTLIEGAAGQLHLQDFEGANVFLIPEDRRREWYRFHPLYREFLLEELRRAEPQIVPRLHELAAGWYQAHGAPELAIEQLLQTPERGCADLIASVGPGMYRSGELSTLKGWLARLGEPAIAAHPPLGILSAWVAASSGQAAEATRWQEPLDSVTFDAPMMDGTASFASSRAMLRAAMCSRGPDQMAADAVFALASEPPWSAWRDLALCLMGESLLLSGRTDEAIIYFGQASECAAALGNDDVRVHSDSQLASILMEAGRWDEAADLIDGALGTVHDRHLGGYGSAVLAHAAAARLALHRGGLADTSRQLDRAMHARSLCTYVMPTIAVRSRLSLARTYRSVGDFSTARHLVREIDDILLQRPAMGAYVDQQRMLRTLVATSGAAGASGSPLTPAELRLLPFLQTHLTIPEIAARLFVTRNTVSTEVGAIYRKLGVSSRNKAVERAVAVGLLGE